MPYIPAKKRDKFFDFFEFTDMIENDGELNYVITTIIHKYLKNNKKNYSTINSIMGVLSCVSLEFYRKIVSPYEDIKELENGKLDYTFENIKKDVKSEKLD